MTRITSIVGITVLLLSLAASSLTAPPGRGEREPRRLPIERLAERLELAQAEVEQLKSIDRERANRVAELKTRGSMLRYDLEELMAGQPIDEQAVFAKLDELGALRTEQAKAQFAARIRMKEVLGDKAVDLERIMDWPERRERRSWRGRRDAPRPSEGAERSERDTREAPLAP